MPMYVSVASSWDELYTPVGLEQVQQALAADEALSLEEYPNGPRGDAWDTYLSQRLGDDEAPWFHVPYDEAQSFTNALSLLCDDQAPKAYLLQFIPQVIFQDRLELTVRDLAERPELDRPWRIYSAEIMAMRWFYDSVHDRFSELAKHYCWDHGIIGGTYGLTTEDMEQFRSIYGEDIPIPLPGDRHEVAQREKGYYVMRLGEMADAIRKAKVPGYVRW